MTSYSFYQSLDSAYEKAVCNLAFKIFETTGKAILLLTESAEQTKIFDNLLWSFSSTKFLPHGTSFDPETHYQHLLVHDQYENLNKAEILLTEHKIAEDFAANFKKVIYIYKQDSKDLNFINDLLNQQKSNQKTKIFKQLANGKWEEKSTN